MPQLYTMPGTCSLACNIAVAWIDAPVEIVNMAYGDHKKDAFRQINDKAKVPAVKLDDGSSLTEAAAILTWLGATYGGEAYARDKMLGYREAEALSYMTSEVHATFGPHFAVERSVDDEDCQDAVKEKAYENLGKQFERMDGILGDAGGEWYLGERSFADAFLYVLTRWIAQTPLDIADYPNLQKHRERMEQDEGVRKALERQDMEPIGG
ncbi:glutathione S-transferase [Altererythrobacter aurantiacus]|uniref:Glutathione S-transferase n=1 Tax=Parapontixanthobacter aurantiacus TaxID=1463599 RepID=A0A844ZH13_9SPHN|nr:glutathione S-transferase [Parapontixanthobacter aurantiacus]MXO86542.1 glutathione S-transferase [Parapontixanthobacter aurantiacus]